jgi:hypothetical protein
MRLYLYGKSQESLSIFITDASLSKQALPTIFTKVQIQVSDSNSSTMLTAGCGPTVSHEAF